MLDVKRDDGNGWLVAIPTTTTPIGYVVEGFPIFIKKANQPKLSQLERIFGKLGRGEHEESPPHKQSMESTAGATLLAKVYAILQQSILRSLLLTRL